MTALNYFGVQKSAWLTRVVVAITLLVLGLTWPAACSAAPPSHRASAAVDRSRWPGVLQAGGLLFFAFAGYARIATLGEEVRDPARTIPRAIPSR